MMKSLILLTAVSFALIARGCWPVAYPPAARGTWTGTVIPVTMYDKNGAAYQGTGLQIETGPEAKSNTMPNDNPGPHPNVILLDKSGHLLQLQFTPGQKLEVSGVIGPANLRAPNGQVIVDSSVQPIYNLLVSTPPKVHEK